MFEKGNQYAKLGSGGKKGRSGRRKAPSTLVKEALEANKKKLPDLFSKLSELALKGDREALMYLIDRTLGKTKIVAEVETEDKLGANLILQLFTRIEQQKRESISSGEDTPLLPEGAITDET